MLSWVQKILAQGLGVRADAAEFEIERVHQMLTPMLDPEQPPRLVFIRFLRQSAKDKMASYGKDVGCLYSPI